MYEFEKSFPPSTYRYMLYSTDVQLKMILYIPITKKYRSSFNTFGPVFTNIYYRIYFKKFNEPIRWPKIEISTDLR